MPYPIEVCKLRMAFCSAILLSLPYLCLHKSRHPQTVVAHVAVLTPRCGTTWLQPAVVCVVSVIWEQATAWCHTCKTWPEKCSRAISCSKAAAGTLIVANSWTPMLKSEPNVRRVERSGRFLYALYRTALPRPCSTDDYN